jgi:hypothetical protein
MDLTDLRHVDVCVHICVYRVSIGHVHNTSGRR